MLSKDFFTFFDQIFIRFATKQITSDLIYYPMPERPHHIPLLQSS